MPPTPFLVPTTYLPFLPHTFTTTFVPYKHPPRCPFPPSTHSPTTQFYYTHVAQFLCPLPLPCLPVHGYLRRYFTGALRCCSYCGSPPYVRVPCTGLRAHHICRAVMLFCAGCLPCHCHCLTTTYYFANVTTIRAIPRYYFALPLLLTTTYAVQLPSLYSQLNFAVPTFYMTRCAYHSPYAAVLLHLHTTPGVPVPRSRTRTQALRGGFSFAHPHLPNSHFATPLLQSGVYGHHAAAVRFPPHACLPDLTHRYSTSRTTTLHAPHLWDTLRQLHTLPATAHSAAFNRHARARTTPLLAATTDTITTLYGLTRTTGGGCFRCAGITATSTAFRTFAFGKTAYPTTARALHRRLDHI